MKYYIRLIALLLFAGLSGFGALFASGKQLEFVGMAALVLIAAIGCAVVAMILLMFVTEVVRPSVKFRRPHYPVMITHREASLHGQRSFRHHPIKFWGVLTINRKFLFGFMFFDEPEYETLKDEK